MTIFNLITLIYTILAIIVIAYSFTKSGGAKAGILYSIIIFIIIAILALAISSLMTITGITL